MSSLGQRLSLAIVAMLFGFMVVLQFQTIKHPQQRDTRDVFQLQSDLAKAQKQHIALNNDLAQAEQLLNKYQSSQSGNQIQAMQGALQQQKIQAGVVPKTGEGDQIEVQTLIGGQTPFNDGIVTAVLIRRLINVLNEYGATDISCGGERIINITPIRMVHNNLLINDQNISNPPMTVDVLATDPAKLKEKLDSSSVLDDFARAGLILNVTVKTKLTVPAYQSPISFHYLKSTPTQGGS